MIWILVLIGGDQGQNNFGDIPGQERRGPRQIILIIIMNCVPVEVFFMYLPSAPQDGDNCFLIKKKKR